MPSKRTKAKAGTKVGKAVGKVGAKAGRRAAPHAGRVAWKLSKAQAKLIRKAMSGREPRRSRYLKYAFFAAIGVGIGALLRRSGGNDGASSSYTGATGHHSPDPGSPAGQRGQTWGSGTVAGTAGGGTAGGAVARESAYSSPSGGPLIGEDHSPGAGGDIPEQQQEVEQRVRTALGEDPRTSALPRVNVEVNDGVAELRGSAPSDVAKRAAGEIAANAEGVSEVRNLITVG